MEFDHRFDYDGDPLEIIKDLGFLKLPSSSIEDMVYEVYRLTLDEEAYQNEEVRIDMTIVKPKESSNYAYFEICDKFSVFTRVNIKSRNDLINLINLLTSKK